MNKFQIVVLIFIFGAETVRSCNEFVCGSVVSKCLLTQSCQCKLSDCFCCKDCLNCLGELFTECCSCLEMCPNQNSTQTSLAPKSQIGDFDGIPELFDTLTDVDDDKWTTYRFPMQAALKRQFEATSHLGDDIDHEAMEIKKPFRVPIVNCTVIFLNACTSSKKCMQYCESMGATSYRWFHDGCCECIGAECINYGINDSKCEECPEHEPEEEITDEFEEDDYDNDNEDDWDYGEDEFNYN